MVNSTDSFDQDSETPKLFRPNMQIEIIFKSNESNGKLFALENVESGSILDVNFYFETIDHYNQTTNLLNGRFSIIIFFILN